MKIITKSEYEKLSLKPRGKVSANPVMIAIKELKVGEILVVDIGEWKPKSPLPRYMGTIYKIGKKFSTRTLGDKKGWVVNRIS